MRGFEYMLNKLGCGPDEILHVSSSLRYDLMTCHDMGITHKVFVNRGHDAPNPFYGYSEISGIDQLPAVLGCNFPERKGASDETRIVLAGQRAEIYRRGQRTIAHPR